MSRLPARAGGLLLDKPVGPTSHDMVASARRTLGIRRVGHTGTLDPFASGLLLLLVGPATRLAEYLAGLPKEYRAEALLGRRTTTDDPEGETLSETSAWKGLRADGVEEVLRRFQGEVEQVPPDFSAKKQRGTAAYVRARRGDAVALEPVRVLIHEIEVEEVALPRVSFRVVCSTGTYIRALARDLGEALGVGGHLTALRRTRIGPLSVDDALAFPRLDDQEARARAWRTPLELLVHLPRVQVGADEAERLRSGQSVPLDGGGEGLEGPVAVAGEDRLVAVGEWDGEGLRPRKVFPRD